jgi:hypothetical protein
MQSNGTNNVKIHKWSFPSPANQQCLVVGSGSIEFTSKWPQFLLCPSTTFLQCISANMNKHCALANYPRNESTKQLTCFGHDDDSAFCSSMRLTDKSPKPSRNFTS